MYVSAVRMMLQETMIVMTASVVVTMSVVTIDNVAVRLGLPEGQGLSGVCLYRNGPDKRRHVMFKSVSSTRKKHDGSVDYVVAGDLAANRVYEGTFARLEDGDQVARFGCGGGQRFEIATPFVVPERDLNAMLEVKESIEQRFDVQNNQEYSSRRSPYVTAEHVSMTVRGLQRLQPTMAPIGNYDDAAINVDIFQLYKKPTGKPWKSTEEAKDFGTAAQYSAYPYARYALRQPVSNLMLADLAPDQMLAVKFHRLATTDNNVLFIYTGGLYPRDTVNLTRMLHGDAVVDPSEDSDMAANIAASQSLQINTKQAYSDSYDIIKNTVKCYVDGMVYNGYPCRNSDVCIPLGWLCDGQRDCLEGDDEYNCYNTNKDIDDNTNNNNIYNNNDNWYYNRGSCKRFEFRCRSRKMSVCLPNSWLCDGRVDCDDGWDENEFNCGRTYSVLRPEFGDFNKRQDHTCINKNHFKCWQGIGCIALRAVCDGVRDCADGSDERVCDNWSSNCNQFTEFKCLNNFNTYNARSCIPRQWVCDLQDDCPHGEDESVTSCLGMDHPTFNGLETDIDDF